MAFRKTIPSMNPDATASEKGIQNLVSPGGAATTSTNGTTGTQILAADNVSIDDRSLAVTPASVQSVVARSNFASCTTAADVAAKVVSIPGFILTPGSKVSIWFHYDNTSVNNTTLNVNGTGAYAIRYNNSFVNGTDYRIQRVITYIFVFDGTYWQLTNASTSYASTTDLVAGTSPLGTGQIYLVYE